ncbi:MAG: PAS domain-containing protein [Planctomycetes bacterium]|nr:PAS domain-containing protein [Planctomycetota bacterium]
MAFNVKILLLFTFLAMTLCSASAAAQQTTSEDRRHNVLILNSYHKSFRWTDNQVSGASAALSDAVGNLELYVEYMDTKRIYTEEYLANLVNTYHLKYDKIRLDAIITTDDNALRFVMDHHENLFQNAPVSFCGINNYSSFSFADTTQFTGLLEVLDIEATIDLALKLHPATSKVYVIVDSTPTGVGQLRDIAKTAGQYPQLKFEYFKGDDYTTAELLEQVSQLPEDSIVLLAVWLRDKNGEYAATDVVGPLISNRSKVPVYGIIDMYLGHGIVGGKLLNSETHGRLAAEMTADILGGETPSNIPVLVESLNPYMFDEAQLHRWDIDPADLPEGSIVLNHSFSLYETYRIQIWSVTGAFVFLLVVVVFLVTNIVNRKKAEKALLQSEDKYRTLVTYTPAVLWTSDQNGHTSFISSNVRQVYGYTQEEILKAGDSLWFGRIHPEDVPGVKTAYEAIMKTGEPFDVEYRIQRKDGHWIWLHDRAIRNYEVEGALRLDGVFLDITDRKRAEIEILSSQQQLRASNQQLSVNEQQLKATNQQLVASEQQLKASNQQLRANEREREALVKTLEYKNKELQDIVYTASHDLKSPLVNIEGFSGELNSDCDNLLKMLADQTGGEDNSHKIETLLKESIPQSLGFITGSAKKMAGLLNGLLQISRVGTVEIYSESVDMNKTINEVLALMEYQIRENNIAVTLETLVDCTGDPDMLNNVFINLIDNAIKYRNPAKEGEIRISGEVKDGMSIYCVADNGIGIAADHQSKVFEIFHRLDPSDDVDGEGLGLTIVTRIVDRLGGRIWLESEDGVGSLFFVALPRG